MLDDIVSELWRKENVTSGYCPRYRYTLIATLTLGTLYYICVDFLPTHTIGESVLPAHFLQAFFFVGLSCGSILSGVRSCGSLFRRPRSCGNYPLGHSLCVILSWESFVARSCAFRWIVWASLPFCFMWVVLVGIRSEDLVRGVLEGNFCTVERL
jgi:hypothetical protein